VTELDLVALGPSSGCFQSISSFDSTGTEYLTSLLELGFDISEAEFLGANEAESGDDDDEAPGADEGPDEMIRLLLLSLLLLLLLLLLSMVSGLLVTKRTEGSLGFESSVVEEWRRRR